MIIMTVTREELVATRKQLLKEMDAYVRNKIGDDFVYGNIWTVTAVPDAPDEEDYDTIAEYDDLWVLAVKTFAKCCGLEDKEND